MTALAEVLAPRECRCGKLTGTWHTGFNGCEPGWWRHIDPSWFTVPTDEGFESVPSRLGRPVAPPVFTPEDVLAGVLDAAELAWRLVKDDPAFRAKIRAALRDVRGRLVGGPEKEDDAIQRLYLLLAKGSSYRKQLDHLIAEGADLARVRYFVQGWPLKDVIRSIRGQWERELKLQGRAGEAGPVHEGPGARRAISNAAALTRLGWPDN